VVFISREE